MIRHVSLGINVFLGIQNAHKLEKHPLCEVASQTLIHIGGAQH